MDREGHSVKPEDEDPINWGGGEESELNAMSCKTR